MLQRALPLTVPFIDAQIRKALSIFKCGPFLVNSGSGSLMKISLFPLHRSFYTIEAADILIIVIVSQLRTLNKYRSNQQSFCFKAKPSLMVSGSLQAT